MEENYRYFWNNGFYVATNERELEIFKNYEELTEEEYKKLCSANTPPNKTFIKNKKPIDVFGNIIYEDILSEKELTKMKIKKELSKELKYLSETDYISIKYHDLVVLGIIDNETILKFNEVQPKRVASRLKIRELEKQI